MSTYKPDTKIFYGPLDNDHRLIPCPNISISLQFNYANDSDTIIGYTYIVTLNGYITALDLRSLNYGDEEPALANYNTGAVMDHAYKLRKILTQNGNILHIVKGNDDSPILRAKGGILRSFDINDSPNNWIHYVQYGAVLEFNSIDFGDNTEDCSSTFLDPTTYNTNGIIDITKYKIKSFSDSWSITFDENDSFNKIKNNDNNTNLNIDNHSFNIQYTISAVGKHFFKYDDEETGESKLLPAWEQAKNFVQYRLYNQVINLIGNILKDTYSSACSSTDGLNDILTPGSGTGLLKGLMNDYKIYNEIISCNTSESEGSFSATYSAIVKSSLGNSAWSSMNAKHTLRKTITTNNSIGTKITNVTINGTIEGLIEGGIIRTNEPLTLPEQGSFLIYNGSGQSKYNNAKDLLDKIFDDNDYGNGIGECGKKDLKLFFKNAIGIDINISPTPADCIPDPPHPINFNLTHDYNGGIINYTVEYSDSRYCGRKFNEISIQISKPTKIYATFNIPNSKTCAIIQELGTYTAKRVTLTIKGIDTSDTGQPETLNLVDEVTNTLNLGCYDEGYLPTLLPQNGNYIITQKQYTKNPIDGSFNITVSYVCTGGCSI